MSFNVRKPIVPKISNGKQLLLLLTYFLIIHILIGSTFSPLLNNQRDDFKSTLILLILSSLLLFLLPAWFWAKQFNKTESIRCTLGLKLISKNSVFLWSILLIVAALPIMIVLSYLNEQAIIYSPFHEFATSAKHIMDETIASLLLDNSFSPPLHLLLLVFVVAVAPAVSEELFFRSTLQRLAYPIFKNNILTIVIIGFIFSLAHFELYGFLVRWLMGIILGYIYLTSKSVLPSILVHFLFNALQVIYLFSLSDESIISYMDQPSSLIADSWLISGLCIVGSISVCIFIIKKINKQLHINIRSV